MRRFIFCLLPLYALSACAGMASPRQTLAVGLSTEAEVLARFGRPVRAWPNADGGQTLEYSTQPFGQTCWMATLGPDGRLLRLEDTLVEASRFRVAVSMTPEQVSRLLGQERSRVFYRFSAEDVWDWNVAPDALGSPPLRFNVHFKHGVVLRTSQSVVYPDRRFPFGD